MARASVSSTAAKVQKLLEPLGPDDRARVLAAASALYGVTPEGGTDTSGISGSGSGAGTTPNAGQAPTAAAYFNKKGPHAKIEQLAVAARWREVYAQSSVHTRDELEKVFGAARMNFDRNNFNRDIDNARTKGFFLRAKEIQLAGYGQQYVDALPDRAAAKAIRRPKGAGRRSPKRKRTAVK